MRADAFEAMKELHERGERFDVVVLDPPAFIKRKKDIPQGQAAYRKLNQLALALIERDGLLVSCSCSYHLAPEELVTAIQAAARHTGRFVQILESGGQSPDHPVHPGHPRNALSQGFLLPRDARGRLNFAAMIAYPDINPIALRLGPIKVHWYGIMYLLGFAPRWLLARSARRAAGLHLEAGGRRRSRLLRHGGRHPRRPAGLRARSTA